MAQNRLPNPPGALAVMAGKCIPGLTTYGGVLGITQVTPAGLQAEIDALNTTVGAFNAARTARTKAYVPLNAANAAAKKFLSDGRGTLVSAWGEKYTLQWAEAGWTDNSTAVPDNLPDRLTLVTALKGFLTANPTYEVSSASITFTPAQADVVKLALEAALTGVDNADTTAINARTARAAADTDLRGDLRILIGILTKKLTPNDARWAAFGLNAPGAAVTPKAPDGLTGHPALAGQIYATCAMPSGADHLRWFLKGPGQTKFENVQDTADGELLLTGQTSGQTVEIYVTAVNPAGESVPSATISVTVG